MRPLFLWRESLSPDSGKQETHLEHTKLGEKCRPGSPKILNVPLLPLNQGTGKGQPPAQAHEARLLSHRMVKPEKTLEIPKSHCLLHN